MHINCACTYCLKPMNIVHCLVLMPASGSALCTGTKQGVDAI